MIVLTSALLLLLLLTVSPVLAQDESGDIKCPDHAYKAGTLDNPFCRCNGYAGFVSTFGADGKLVSCDLLRCPANAKVTIPEWKLFYDVWEPYCLCRGGYTPKYAEGFLGDLVACSPPECPETGHLKRQVYPDYTYCKCDHGYRPIKSTYSPYLVEDCYQPECPSNSHIIVTMTGWPYCCCDKGYLWTGRNTAGDITSCTKID
jgi:hypothetical protein